MRHLPLLITLIISASVHVALLNSLSGIPADAPPQRTPVVEIGLVHRIAKELATSTQQTSPSESVACNPQASTPKNQKTEAPASPPVPPESQTMTAETTEEVTLATAETGREPTPLLSTKSQQVDLVARESPAEHASTMPSLATAPVCTYNPPPRYPPDALRQNWEGDVLLRATIRIDGNVDSIVVTKSSGYSTLDEAAVAAVLTWQFTETAATSEPAAVSIPVHFRIRNN